MNFVKTTRDVYIKVELISKFEKITERGETSYRVALGFGEAQELHRVSEEAFKEIAEGFIDAQA